MKPASSALVAAAAAALLVGACASTPAPSDYDRQALAMLRASFRPQGQAGLDRLEQDALQQACSGAAPPSAEVARRLEAQALATIRPPSDGRYLGDWKEGEKLAQSGRGMTWSDKAGDSGGSCYNCHQISPREEAFGTIGPSLAGFGKLRGNRPEIQQYVYGKIYNAKAYNACSQMPRFGRSGTLTEQQIKHLVALLLDPASPVNR